MVMTRIVLRQSDLTDADLSYANLASGRPERGLAPAQLNCAMLDLCRVVRSRLAPGFIAACQPVSGGFARGKSARGTAGRGRFLGADLTNALLTTALYNSHTRWPEGFDPAAAGAEMRE